MSILRKFIKFLSHMNFHVTYHLYCCLSDDIDKPWYDISIVTLMSLDPMSRIKSRDMLHVIYSRLTINEWTFPLLPMSCNRSFNVVNILLSIILFICQFSNGFQMIFTIVSFLEFHDLLHDSSYNMMLRLILVAIMSLSSQINHRR